jgi:hypothetical protein
MSKTTMQKRNLLYVALGAAVLSAAPISLRWSPATAPSLSLNRADARIGNPLSAGSIAGVNRRVNRRATRRAYYGGAVGQGAAGAYYGGAGSNYYGSSGYNNLYSYAPAANAAAATNTASQEYKYSTGRPTNEGGMGYNVQNSTFPPGSPELYAACLNRNYGTCPEQ